MECIRLLRNTGNAVCYYMRVMYYWSINDAFFKNGITSITLTMGLANQEKPTR